MTISLTGIILAGGLSKRFDGRNKAFIEIGGKRIIDRQVAIYRKLFEQIILVTNAPVAYMNIDALIISDHYDQRSSLNGLHAGLLAAAHDYVFCTACDTPFIDDRLAACLIEHIDPKVDIIVPSTSAGFEPMFAIYKKTCLPAMAWQLEHDLHKIQGLFRKLRVKMIPESKLRAIDPELVSFFNINTPADLVLAEKLSQAKG